MSVENLPAPGDVPARPPRAVNRLRVVVACRHAVFGEGLIAMLTTRGVETVGFGQDPVHVCRVVVSARPDACVLDERFGEGVVRQLAARLRRVAPNVRLVVLARPAGVADELFRRGLVDGVVHHDVGVDALEETLELVAGGHRARTGSRLPVQRRDSSSDAAALSGRETQVLRRLELGATNAQIAADLGITVNTVRTHVHHVFEKLGVDCRGKAVRVALSGPPLVKAAARP